MTKEIDSKKASTASASISYKGIVTVKTLRGDLLINKKVYYNTGLPNLFKTLCFILAGQATKNSLPSRVQLFELDENADNAAANAGGKFGDPVSFDWSAALDAEALKANTLPILYASAPIVQSNTDGFMVKFQFRVPYSAFFGERTYLIALMSMASDSLTDALAFYKFTSNDGTEWDPLVLNPSEENFSLILEWSMQFKNA